MKWLAHKVRKPITGAFIGVFGLLEVFVPKLTNIVTSPLALKGIGFILGPTAKGLIVVYADWKKPTVAQ